jgi:hypothetical protein
MPSIPILGSPNGKHQNKYSAMGAPGLDFPDLGELRIKCFPQPIKLFLLEACARRP